MNDLHLCAALHHITDTAPDRMTAALLSDGATLTFTDRGAVVEKDGVTLGRFVLGEPCAAFASVPLLFLGLPGVTTRPVLWRTVPLRALRAFEVLVA